MRYLVLGSSGMAGHLIALFLKEQGHEVTGVSRREISFINTIRCDVKDMNRLESIITEGGYDAVINCIGLLNEDAEQNKDTAVYINSFLPHKLAAITRTMNTKIIQLSTDCVFSGEKGSYSEDTWPDGTSFYARTKALGELRDNKNLTLRNSIVGPDINKKGKGLLNWFLQQHKEIEGYANVFWSGVTTLELAKIIEQAVEQKITGLKQMVYEAPIAKHDLLCLFNRYLREDQIMITQNLQKKENKSLRRTDTTFSYMVPTYETMVKELGVWIQSHKGIYPDYYSKA